MNYDIMNNQLTLILQEQPLLLEDLLEQEKREQQQQQPIPTAGTTPTAAQNLPPGAQPISSQKEVTDPSMVTMNPTMVTGQIVPNQPVNVNRPPLPGNLQPQRPPSTATVQTFMPRTGPPGSFPQSQVPANQRMVNPRQPGAPQQTWPQRPPQEVTLQQRGPGNPPLPQGGMVPMQVPAQQQGQIQGTQMAGAQVGVPQQVPGGIQVGVQPQSAVPPGIASATGSALTPPPMSNTPAPPTPPENPQTDEDRQKVSFVSLV